MTRQGAKNRWLQTAVDYLYYFAGSVAYALAVDIFTVPNHLVPGGVTGLSTMINFLVPGFPIGVGIILINLPLLLIAWRQLGRNFTLRTATVTVLSSVLIDILDPFLPEYTGNPLLAALFGGVLTGIGLSLIFLRGATTGGSEIVARVLEKKHPHVPIGRLILLVDGVIIALSAFVFRSAEPAMYAAVLVFISSTVIDELLGGARRTRTVLVVSQKDGDLAKAVMERMNRGVTLLDAEGAYTGTARQILLCAVRPSEVHPLRQVVREYDPSAFIIVLNSDQVLGNGFQD